VGVSEGDLIGNVHDSITSYNVLYYINANRYRTVTNTNPNVNGFMYSTHPNFATKIRTPMGTTFFP